MEIIELPIDEVVEYENNPRDNEDAVAKVAQSILQFGFINPIAVDANKVIISGHTRLLAARQLGYETVPVVIHDVGEEEARIARIAENRTREFSTWDAQKLLTGLQKIESPVKTAFFAPSARDKYFFYENKILSFGKIELSISKEDDELFSAHFNAYVERTGSHLGFINYLVGGIADV